jgi:hypothetical protein
VCSIGVLANTEGSIVLTLGKQRECVEIIELNLRMGKTMLYVQNRIIQRRRIMYEPCKISVVNRKGFYKIGKKHISNAF